MIKTTSSWAHYSHFESKHIESATCTWRVPYADTKVDMVFECGKQATKHKMMCDEQHSICEWMSLCKEHKGESWNK